IYINEHEMKFKDIKESQDSGVSIIYQELALVGEMTVAENIFLGHDLMRSVKIDWHKLYAEAREWLNYIGLSIDPMAKINELSVGKQQLVEIVKALPKKSEIIILDEPTAALTESDVEVLKRVLRDL